MKKMKIVFPVLLLVCAGIVMTGCPSDPAPPISDFNMVFKGGKYQFLFDTPLIEHGKVYEVILTIENCDDAFIGSRLGGKICYKMDLDGNDEKILSGWDRPAPDTVSKALKTYKWTFTAGAKNDDSLEPESDATTPNGGKQYFSFTAQDNAQWLDFPSGTNFNIKGKFEVKVKEEVAWISEGEVTLGNEDGTAGKGNLTNADMAKIKALPADSKIVLTVNVTVSDDPGPGWGVGTVGSWDSGSSLEIKIPNNAPVGDFTFTVEFTISDILAVQPSDPIAINLWNGATVTKAELFKPGA